MPKEKLKKVGKVKLTQYEYSQGYSYLFEEFGPIIQIWKQEKLDEMISDFWIQNGKKSIDD